MHNYLKKRLAMTLQQSDFRFIKKTFEITDRGLSVKDKNLISTTDYLVEFDNIGPEKIRTKAGQKWILYLGTGSLVISLLVFLTSESKDLYPVLFYLVIGIGLLVVFLITYKDVLFLSRTDSLTGIEFLFNKPTKDEFENFINAVFEKRNKVLDDKYGQITTHMTYEANYGNQVWLLNRHVISQEEFNNRLIKMNELFKRTENSIGFKIPRNDN